VGLPHLFDSARAQGAAEAALAVTKQPRKILTTGQID